MPTISTCYTPAPLCSDLTGPAPPSLQLQKVSLFGLHANELVIFFVNVHNALLLHALVIRAAQVRPI